MVVAGPGRRLASHDRGALGVAGFGIALLFTYAICWAFGCVGLVVRKGPEAAMSIGFIVLFPLAFVSNAMVPTQGMPAWLRVIADWNPVSAVTAACRQLFGNPNPSALVQDWPMQHPVAAALLWSAALLPSACPWPSTSSGAAPPTERPGSTADQSGTVAAAAVAAQLEVGRPETASPTPTRSSPRRCPTGAGRRRPPTP